MSEDGTYDLLAKKEVLQLEREKAKLLKVLDGIRDMDKHPGLVFIVDTRKEKIALSEAKKLKIPIVGVCDTNCRSGAVRHPDPGQRRRPELDQALRGFRRGHGPRSPSDRARGTRAAAERRRRPAKRAGAVPSPRPDSSSRLGAAVENTFQQANLRRTRMEITAAQVKELREKTGAGMMDCKKALKEMGGDVEKAVEHLRKSGSAQGREEGRAGDGRGHHRVATSTRVRSWRSWSRSTARPTSSPRPTSSRRSRRTSRCTSPRRIRSWSRARSFRRTRSSKEREIYREQALKSGKPEKIVDKIVDGTRREVLR